MQYKIALVGEAWGEHEERERMPFVGPAGWQLNSMLKEAGIVRADCFLTNCFNLRPRPSNKIENLCATRERSVMRSRRYHLASTSAMNFSLNSTDFTQNLLKLIQMSLSVSGELPPGQYYVTVEYRNFVGQSRVPPFWQEKNASPPSTPPTSSKEATITDTSLSSISRKPVESPSIPRSADQNESSTPSPFSQNLSGSPKGLFHGQDSWQSTSRLGEKE